MAPKVASSSQCLASKVQDSIYDAPEDEMDDPQIGMYGFLQIDGYRSQKKQKDCDAGPLASRWVMLPRDMHVETYDAFEHVEEEWPSKRPDAETLHSCLRQAHVSACKDVDDACEIVSTTSTTASSSDCRRVHFRDGCIPGWDEDGIEADLPDESDLPVADWRYVDRDICGFSLHVYAPDAETKDFASSPYAASFLKELDLIEFHSMYEHQRMEQDEEERAAYKQEERRLDKALLLAGVHVNCIHAAPEELLEQIVCI